MKNKYKVFYMISLPMNYMQNILTNKNIGLDGNNDNTILLLFNMLNNIDDNPKDKKYMPLS